MHFATLYGQELTYTLRHMICTTVLYGNGMSTHKIRGNNVNFSSEAITFCVNRNFVPSIRRYQLRLSNDQKILSIGS